MEEIDGIKVFTVMLEYLRFLQYFKGIYPPEHDEGLYVTKEKKIYYYGELIGIYKPNNV